MPTAEVRRTASDVNGVLEGADPVSIITIAASTGGGIISAQRIADRVLPELGLNPEPESLTDALGSAGLKGGLALATGYAAAELTGLPQVGLAFLAVGMLTSGGVDLISVFTDIPDLTRIRGRTGTQAQAQFRASSSGVQSITANSPSGGSSSGSSPTTVTPATDGGTQFTPA
jgi:hypothetical protein